MDATNTASGQGSTRNSDWPMSSTLTASSSSDYPPSVSTDSHSGGPPSTPLRSRVSGGWDRQLQPSAPNARVASVDDKQQTVEDEADYLPSSLWPKDDSDSSDDAVTGYQPLERSLTQATGSRSKRFFQSLVKKFNKTSVRYGLLPDNKQEQDRNTIQHQVISDVFEGRLHLAPVSRPKRVLDVGTGPGVWALEYARRHLNCSVLGVDINPVHPPYTVPNCSFMTLDITHDWNFDGKFDFIHVRQLGDVQEKKKLIQSIFNNLNPGGWVELTEWIAILQSPNHSLDGTAFLRWNDLLEQGMQNFGTTLYYPNDFKPLLQETGFERIIETKNGAPTNACYPGKKLQRIGHLMTRNWELVLEPLSLPVFTQALGWTPEQIKPLLVEVRREIGNTRYHSFMTLITICARKPSNGSSMASTSSSTSAAASVASLPAIASGPPTNMSSGPPGPEGR